MDLEDWIFFKEIGKRQAARKIEGCDYAQLVASNNSKGIIAFISNRNQLVVIKQDDIAKYLSAEEVKTNEIDLQQAANCVYINDNGDLVAVLMDNQVKIVKGNLLESQSCQDLQLNNQGKYICGFDQAISVLIQDGTFVMINGSEQELHQEDAKAITMVDSKTIIFATDDQLYQVQSKQQKQLLCESLQGNQFITIQKIDQEVYAGLSVQGDQDVAILVFKINSLQIEILYEYTDLDFVPMTPSDDYKDFFSCKLSGYIKYLPERKWIIFSCSSFNSLQVVYQDKDNYEIIFFDEIRQYQPTCGWENRQEKIMRGFDLMFCFEPQREKIIFQYKSDDYELKAPPQVIYADNQGNLHLRDIIDIRPEFANDNLLKKPQAGVMNQSFLSQTNPFGTQNPLAFQTGLNLTQKSSQNQQAAQPLIGTQQGSLFNFGNPTSNTLIKPPEEKKQDQFQKPNQLLFASGQAPTNLNIGGSKGILDQTVIKQKEDLSMPKAEISSIHLPDFNISLQDDSDRNGKLIDAVKCTIDNKITNLKNKLNEQNKVLLGFKQLSNYAQLEQKLKESDLNQIEKLFYACQQQFTALQQHQAQNSHFLKQKLSTFRPNSPEIFLDKQLQSIYNKANAQYQHINKFNVTVTGPCNNNIQTNYFRNQNQPLQLMSTSHIRNKRLKPQPIDLDVFIQNLQKQVSDQIQKLNKQKRRSKGSFVVDINQIEEAQFDIQSYPKSYIYTEDEVNAINEQLTKQFKHLNLVENKQIQNQTAQRIPIKGINKTQSCNFQALTVQNNITIQQPQQIKQDSLQNQLKEEYKKLEENLNKYIVAKKSLQSNTQTIEVKLENQQKITEIKQDAKEEQKEQSAKIQEVKPIENKTMPFFVQSTPAAQPQQSTNAAQQPTNTSQQITNTTQQLKNTLQPTNTTLQTSTAQQAINSPQQPLINPAQSAFGQQSQFQQPQFQNLKQNKQWGNPNQSQSFAQLAQTQPNQGFPQTQGFPQMPTQQFQQAPTQGFAANLGQISFNSTSLTAIRGQQAPNPATSNNVLFAPRK